MKYFKGVLGLDEKEDSDLMSLAREALVSPLPSGWKSIRTTEGDVYYCNMNKTPNEYSFKNPNDDLFIARAKELKLKKMNEKMKRNQRNHDASLILKELDEERNDSKMDSKFSSRFIENQTTLDSLRKERKTIRGEISLLKEEKIKLLDDIKKKHEYNKTKIIVNSQLKEENHRIKEEN